MKKIAIIGGIGSGKSSVLQHLTRLNQRTCDCDDIYREITKSKEYIALIDKTFGTVKDGAIDKKALGETVFNDKTKLDMLNRLSHPLVFSRLNEIFLQDASNLYVEVSAFERSMADKFDIIIYVKADKKRRIDRVKLRSGFDEKYILSIIQRQMPPEEMQEVADFVILNDGSLQHLYEQVEWIAGWIE